MKYTKTRLGAPQIVAYFVYFTQIRRCGMVKGMLVNCGGVLNSTLLGGNAVKSIKIIDEEKQHG